jgi:hypothetical protein
MPAKIRHYDGIGEKAKRVGPRSFPARGPLEKTAAGRSRLASARGVGGDSGRRPSIRNRLPVSAWSRISDRELSRRRTARVSAEDGWGCVFSRFWRRMEGFGLALPFGGRGRGRGEVRLRGERAIPTDPTQRLFDDPLLVLFSGSGCSPRLVGFIRHRLGWESCVWTNGGLQQHGGSGLQAVICASFALGLFSTCDKRVQC